jgi:hypothetical protein
MHIEQLPYDIQYHVLKFVPKCDIPYISQANKVLSKRVYQLLKTNKPIHNINSSSDIFISKFHEEIKIVRAEYPLIIDKKSYLKHHLYICEQFKKYEADNEDNVEMYKWTNKFLNTPTSITNIDVLYCYISALYCHNNKLKDNFMEIFSLCCEYIKITLLYLTINRESENTSNIICLLSYLYTTKYDIISCNRTWFLEYSNSMRIANFISIELAKINVISLKILDLELHNSINDIVRLLENIQVFFISDVGDNIYEEPALRAPFSKMESNLITTLSVYYILIYLEHLHSKKLQLHPEYKKDEEPQIREMMTGLIEDILNNDDNKNTICAIFMVPVTKITKKQIRKYILSKLNNTEICKECIKYIKRKNDFVDDKASFTFL